MNLAEKLLPFLGKLQAASLPDLVRQEKDLMEEVMKRIENTPEAGTTRDVPMKDAVCHLHYFHGSCDWWVMEMDREKGLAFGFVNLGDPANAELGYFLLEELKRIPFVELDFHFETTPLKEILIPLGKWAKEYEQGG